MDELFAAVFRLETMAREGCSAAEVRAEAERIALGWCQQASCEVAPDRPVWLVEALRRWCAASSQEHAHCWERLHGAGRCEEAETARQWVEALDEAQRTLRSYA